MIETQVVTLRGDDPTVELKIEPSWGPNVYVSVLALRGRIREVPWYSFFTWGWKEPLAWWQSFRYDGQDYQAPTALVDLAKPAFKLGLAAIKVGIAAHELQVERDGRQGAVPGAREGDRQGARDAGRQAAAGAEVALAAVDEGLLELHAERSWNLLDAMMQRARLGRRDVHRAERDHRPAPLRPQGGAAGGGGGHGATRELFDTLLLWKPSVVLDANGEATSRCRSTMR